MAKPNAPLPEYRAQLATLAESPPTGALWLHELKYDGYRIGCRIENGTVRLESRRGNDWTKQFPEVVAAAKRLKVKQALLDGEVAIVLPDGRTSFQALQNAFSEPTRIGLTYFVFDLLHLDGYDTAALPLEERKAACETLLQGLRADGTIRFSAHFAAEGPTVLKNACELGAEGIVSKRRDQPYRPGRNEGWLKTKCVKRQEFVIGGFTDPEGSRTGIGSFLVGYYEEDELRFGGKVGTGPGFTTSFLAAVRRKLEAVEQKECPFTPRPPGWLGRNAHWVRPALMGEVVFTEWTEGGHVRHGSFQGFRKDKNPTEIVRDDAVSLARATRGAERGEPKAVRTRVVAAAVDRGQTVRGVAITSPERPVYPELGVTKLELASFYSAVAKQMLPYIARRPLTLVRCEKGVRGANALRSECMFLRHEPGWHRWAHEPIRRVQIQEQKKVGEYLVVDSAEALVALVQGDILEIHTWNSTIDNLEKPDRLVFDLDPGRDVAWPLVVEAARHLRDAFARLDLQSWVKLTGGKGLHVVVPFRPERGWDEVFAFARAVAEACVRKNPGLFTLEFGKRGRESRILVDYKRNHRAAVAVAAYSARARPNGAVSVPVSWRELKPSLASDQYSVTTLPKRLERLRTEPWKDFWSARQRLPGIPRRE